MWIFILGMPDIEHSYFDGSLLFSISMERDTSLLINIMPCLSFINISALLICAGMAPKREVIFMLEE